MRKVLITAACNAYFQQYLPRIRRSAEPYFDEIVTLTEKDLPSDWVESHRPILHQVGHGAYSWKPHVILRQLNGMPPADVLMWLDATARFLSSPEPMISECEKNGGVMAVRNHLFTNGDWTRRDTFVRMGCDELRYWAVSQIQGCALLFQNTPRAITLLEDWRRYCDDVECVRYGPSTAPNLDGFQDHRADQSILSILMEKHGLPLAEWGGAASGDGIFVRSHDLHAVPYSFDEGRKMAPWDGYIRGT